jgi:hypothetical protein
MLNKYELAREDALSVIDQLKEHNVYMLIISGGEPLLHPNFFEIVDYADKNDILPLVAITGTKISDDEIKKYAEARIPTVQLSLDGASEDLNDRLRMQGSYAEVVSTVRRFQSVGVNVNLAICVHQGNFREFGEFLKLCREWNVFRVKLGIYKQIHGDAKVRELDGNQLQGVFDTARRFMDAHELARDWVACPTMDVWTGKPLLRQSGLPPLTIGADGRLSSGDNGEMIGKLADGPLAEQYGVFADKKIEQFYSSALRAVFDEYSVGEAIEENALDANALIYKDSDKYVVYVRRDLPRQIKFFSLLHEIGHIATNTLRASPRSGRCEDEERAANLWALNRIKPYMRRDAFESYNRAAEKSEVILYEQISKNLENDLIGYY